MLCVIIDSLDIVRIARLNSPVREMKMQFQKIVREERHYCAHLFRLLCHEKEIGGAQSGLARFLALAKVDVPNDLATIAQAEFFVEVAVFRDFYQVHHDRRAFLADLYDAFLPLVAPLYGGRIDKPVRTGEFDHEKVHPKDFAWEVGHRPDQREQDVLFYREFSALFNAKPDLLIICGGRMLWFEVKFWVPFDSSQLQRTKNIAALCSSSLFASVFDGMPSEVLMLGTQRHRVARRQHGFVDWAKVGELAEQILPGGKTNYSAQALRTLVSLDLTRVGRAELDA